MHHVWIANTFEAFVESAYSKTSTVRIHQRHTNIKRCIQWNGEPIPLFSPTFLIPIPANV